MRDIPGFTADVSLYQTREFYELGAVWVDGLDRQEVVQQFEFDPGEELVPVPDYHQRYCWESLWGPGQGGALYCQTCCWGLYVGKNIDCSLPYRCS